MDCSLLDHVPHLVINGDSPDIEEIQDAAPTSLSLVVLAEAGSDASHADEDGGEKVGQLEIELEPRLTGGLYCTRHTKSRERKS